MESGFDRGRVGVALTLALALALALTLSLTLALTLTPTLTLTCSEVFCGAKPLVPLRCSSVYFCWSEGHSTWDHMLG